MKTIDALKVKGGIDEDKLSETHAWADWKDRPEDMLEYFDELLKPFKLEVEEIANLGIDGVVFRVIERAPEKKAPKRRKK